MKWEPSPKPSVNRSKLQNTRQLVLDYGGERKPEVLAYYHVLADRVNNQQLFVQWLAARRTSKQSCSI